jgi:hypothetical protein
VGGPVAQQVVQHGIKTLIWRIPRLHEVVVEADGVGVVLEDEGRPQLVLGVVHGLEDARVLDAFQDLELALGSPRQGLAGARRLGGDGIESDAADKPGEGNVLGLPVLVAGAIEEHADQLVVPHAALALACRGAAYPQKL